MQVYNIIVSKLSKLVIVMMRVLFFAEMLPWLRQKTGLNPKRCRFTLVRNFAKHSSIR